MQESLNKLREAAKDKDKEIELLYFDETGIANVPNVQRSWSPLGEPHSAVNFRYWADSLHSSITLISVHPSRNCPADIFNASRTRSAKAGAAASCVCRKPLTVPQRSCSSSS